MPNRTIGELAPIYKQLRQLLLLQYYCLRSEKKAKGEAVRLAALFLQHVNELRSKENLPRLTPNNISDFVSDTDTSFISHLYNVWDEGYGKNDNLQMNDLYDAIFHEFAAHAIDGNIEPFMVPLLYTCFESERNKFLPFTGDISVGEYFSRLAPFWFLYSNMRNSNSNSFSEKNEGLYVYIRKATKSEIDWAKEVDPTREIDSIRGAVKIYRPQTNMMCPMYTNYYAGMEMDSETGTYKRYVREMTGHIADVGSRIYLISQETGERDELSYMSWPKVKDGYKTDPKAFFCGIVNAMDPSRKIFSASIICRRVTDTVVSTMPRDMQDARNPDYTPRQVDKRVATIETKELDDIGGFNIVDFSKRRDYSADNIAPLVRIATGVDGSRYFNILDQLFPNV